MMNVKYETNSYTIKEGFEHLNIDGALEDVTFRLSDDGACRVVCYEQEKMKHNARVNDNTLDITGTDTREWYERIALFSFDSPKTTSGGKCEITTNTGDIRISIKE